MTTTQRAIKYCVITFATLLAVGIISFIAGVVIKVAAGAVIISGITDDIGDEMDTIDFSKDFDATGITKLDVDNSYEQFYIKTGDRFHVEAENVREDYIAEVKNGNTLYIGHKSRNFSFFFINISWPGEYQAKVTLTIPKDFMADEVRFDFGSGACDVEGIRTADFKMECGSGRVTLTDLKTERFVMDGGSGGIVMKDITADTTAMESSSGRVQISDATFGKYSLDSGSGSVVMNNVSVKDYKLEASSGRVAFESGSIDGDIYVDAGSGSVVISAKANPDDYEVRLSTGSGGVWINGEKKSDDYHYNPKNAIYDMKVEGGSGRVSIDLDNK